MKLRTTSGRRASARARVRFQPWRLFAPGPFVQRLNLTLVFAVCLFQVESRRTFAAPQDTAPPSRTELPLLRLGRLADQNDEAEFLRSITLRSTNLAQTAEAAADPVERAGLLLSAANLLLAHALEPACSASILEIKDRAGAVSSEATREVLDRVMALLAKAGELLKTPQGAAQDSNKADPAVTQSLEAMEAFSAGLQALLLPVEGAEGERASRRAASRLSILLEDSAPQVTAAATLYYALLRSREADPEAALLALDSVLSEPPQAALPHALHSRLLRCRLLARQGGYAAALALLLQLEGRCGQWLADEELRAEALRTVGWVRFRVLEDWRSRLNAPEQEAERRWCDRQIDSLARDRFGPDRNTLLRLSVAIPVLPISPALDKPSAP